MLQVASPAPESIVSVPAGSAEFASVRFDTCELLTGMCSAAVSFVRPQEVRAVPPETSAHNMPLMFPHHRPVEMMVYRARVADLHDRWVRSPTLLGHCVDVWTVCQFFPKAFLGRVLRAGCEPYDDKYRMILVDGTGQWVDRRHGVSVAPRTRCW